MPPYYINIYILKYEYIIFQLVHKYLGSNNQKKVQQFKSLILLRISRSGDGGGETTSDIQRANAILQRFVARYN